MIDMYLKNEAICLKIPINPNVLTIKSPSRVYQNLSIVDKGEIQRILKEATLREVSFSSYFSKYQDYPVLSNGQFEEAINLVNKIESFRMLFVPIRFIVTGEWELNIRCTITEFNYDIKGQGDAWYNITFKEDVPGGARALKQENGVLKIKSGNEIGTKPMNEAYVAKKVDNLAEATGGVYVVKKGDNLTKISQAYLGNGHRWKEIWELNKDIIKNPNLIYPGQTFKLPLK